MSPDVAPVVRRIATSDCLSLTTITSVETMLNAATATTISSIRKITEIDNNNPRYIHETKSALNQVVYRTCRKTNCHSRTEKRKACVRKVIYNDGTIGYYCQDCL